MRLAEWVARYALANDFSEKYVKHLYTSQRSFESFAGALAVEEITVEQLNAWADQEAAIHHKRTAKNKLSALAAVLRAAAEESPPLRAPLVGKLKRLKIPEHSVKAFTPGEVEKLLKGAAETRGYFTLTGIKKSDWWLGDLNGSWDLGMRAGDMLELMWAEVDEERLIVVKTQHKTGRIHKGRIRPETLDRWRVIQAQGVARESPYVLPFVGDRNKFCAAFRKLAIRSGVEGTSKFLRRGGATQIWKLHGPAAAAKYLGHADGTGALAWKNYIDRSQLDDQLPMPPPIG